MPELRYDINTGEFVRNLVGQWRAMRDACLGALTEAVDTIYIPEMQKKLSEHEIGDYKEWYFRTPARETEKHFPLTDKPKKFGSHFSSSPGDPPAKLSGALSRGFGKRVYFSRGHTRVIAEIFNEMAYAYYLEYGSPVGGGRGFPRRYMEPRPFMAPVLFNAQVNLRVVQVVRDYMEMAGHAYGAR